MSAVSQGVDDKCDFVTWPDCSWLPANAPKMLRAGHFDAPLAFKTFVRSNDLDKGVGVGPAKLPDGASQLNLARSIEHREGMMSYRRSGQCENPHGQQSNSTSAH